MITRIFYRERTESYSLRVVATDLPGGGSDQKTSTVMVKVQLLDVNDSPPRFSQSRYTAVVPENSPVNTLVAQVYIIKLLNENFSLCVSRPRSPLLTQT